MITCGFMMILMGFGLDKKGGPDFSVLLWFLLTTGRAGGLSFGL
jgi:hypothetical protein